MILIRRESASHWYSPTGEACHTVPRADGMGERSATLRDARKLNLFPSVTNCLGVLAKPGLDAWKQEQAILAALTLPRNDGESLDDFARRVVTDMSEQVDAAADLGSAIHAACEVYAQSAALPESPEIAQLFEPVRQWFDADVVRIASVEEAVVHGEYGYAGRVDMVAKLRCTGDWAVVDFKTQRIKLDAKGQPKPNFYETWPMQLEAYRQAILHAGTGKQPRDIVSLVINSQCPMPVIPKVWPREEQLAYWRAFLNARNLWVWLKGYDPVAQAAPSHPPLAS